MKIDGLGINFRGGIYGKDDCCTTTNGFRQL